MEALYRGSRAGATAALKGHNPSATLAQAAKGDFMELSRDDVAHIATLCRVAMTEEELERMRSELSGILGHFQALQELDVEGVTPTGHPGAVDTVLRDDAPRPSLPREDALANAPLREDAYFRVRSVLDE